MPVSVSLDYGPNPVRSWAFFTYSQEQCTIWADSKRSIAKSLQQIINSKVPFMEETECRGDGESPLPGTEAFLWSSSMQTGSHLLLYSRAKQSWEAAHLPERMILPFSLPGTQDIPITKNIFKKQSHSSPERFASEEKEPLDCYLKFTFFTTAHNLF